MRVGGRGGCKMEETMEGKRGIPLSFPSQNRTELISFLMYVGVNNTLMSGPLTQKVQNKQWNIPLS